jgi:gamma-glutamylcyclotransferase (GGCT)/AIG2-like uncharacterized protein YtfP
MQVVHYFAYGSNMNPERVRARGLEVLRCEGALVRGFAMRFDKVSMAHGDCAHANIVYSAGDVVEGVLYELACVDEIRKMDRFESAPVNYGRDVIVAEVEGRQVPAWTYFANRHARKDGLLPPSSYMAHLLAGRAFLSAGYVAWLEAHPCVER